MIVFYGLFLLLAIGGAFLWKTSLLFCILLFLTAAAGIGLQLLWKGKKGAALSMLPLPVCLILCLAAEQTASAGGIGDYDERIEKAVSCIEKGNLDQATELLDELDERFGVTDLSLYARAEQFISLRDYDHGRLHKPNR